MAEVRRSNAIHIEFDFGQAASVAEKPRECLGALS